MQVLHPTIAASMPMLASRRTLRALCGIADQFSERGRREEVLLMLDAIYALFDIAAANEPAQALGAPA